MIPAAETALSDIETTRIEYVGGVIQYPKKTHLIISKDHERKKMHVFGPSQDSLLEGVDFLERSQRVVFHNGIGFDVPTLIQNFNLKIRDDKHFVDSLVCCRLFYSNIKEDEDFALFEKHKMRPASLLKFTGDLIGKHSLEAWGLRLKTPMPKGTYAEDMEAFGIDPWAEWNEKMQEYAIQDVEVLEALWVERLKDRFFHSTNTNAIAVEHYLAELMEQVKRSGIKFNREWALKVIADLEEHAATLNETIQQEFPPRLEPLKWEHRPIPLGMPDLDEELAKEYEEKCTSEDPADIIRCNEIKNSGPQQMLTQLMWEHEKNEIYRPRFGLPEGYLREQWGVSFTPKVTRKVVDKVTKEVVYIAEKDSPFTKCGMVALNPNSRPQIARRLLEFGWIPEEFTDTGAPSLSEVELLKIEEQFPAARSIANYLLVQKRLGAISSGEKAWMNLLDEYDFIHPTIHACNTVAFRASHSDPNISQVPSVKMKDVLDENGNKVVKEVPKVKYTFNRQTNKWDQEQIGFEKKVKQEVLTGFAGKWGYDCRACFTVPEGFRMVGSDLAGIEMRAWAHYLWKFDDGAFADVVLNKDVHEENRIILGFSDRRKAKEWLYAAMYGAGDEKLGFIIEPLATPARQKQLGAASRARFMAGLKGYEQLNDELMLGVRRGYLKGLDGRRAPVRKQHAALNTLLQSAGAIISKYWIIFVMDILENEHGMKWGYENDFTLLLYSHDELQFAVRPEFVEITKEACATAALKAGSYLDFRLPVEVGVDDGEHWGATH